MICLRNKTYKCKVKVLRFVQTDILRLTSVIQKLCYEGLKSLKKLYQTICFFSLNNIKLNLRPFLYIQEKEEEEEEKPKKGAKKGKKIAEKKAPPKKRAAAKKAVEKSESEKDEESDEDEPLAKKTKAPPTVSSVPKLTHSLQYKINKHAC